MSEEKYRTQMLCYEILDCLKQMRVNDKYKHVDKDKFNRIADQVIGMESYGKEAFSDMLESSENFLLFIQRQYRWYKNPCQLKIIELRKEYCNLLQQAIIHFDRPFEHVKLEEK